MQTVWAGGLTFEMENRSFGGDGGTPFRDMQTVISDVSHLADDGIHGLLGYKFLSRQKTGINYGSRKLFMY